MAEQVEVEGEFVTGASVLASALKSQGVEYIFGVVGKRVLAIACAAQTEGIKFIGMRNEQAVSMLGSIRTLLYLISFYVQFIRVLP